MKKAPTQDFNVKLALMELDKLLDEYRRYPKSQYIKDKIQQVQNMLLKHKRKSEGA